MTRAFRFGGGLVLGCGLVVGSYLLGQGRGVAGEPSKLAPALSDQPFTTTIPKTTAKKGQPATVPVVFKPAAGYHLNKEYPTSLTLHMPPGVTAVKAELKKLDAKLSETEGRFEVVLTAAEGGKKVVPGELRFAVCTDTTCDPQRSQISIELDVK